MRTLSAAQSSLIIISVNILLYTNDHPFCHKHLDLFAAVPEAVSEGLFTAAEAAGVVEGKIV